jgi:peptide/nickel transport system substrate-binding protein
MHPDLVHEDPFMFTWFLQLNTHEPPFDDVRARRALALAVDRRQFLGAYRTGGEPACQMPPPGFPGFAPRCTNTANPDASGAWHGPDLGRARQLVARSGTAGQRVDVWWWDVVPDEGRYLTRLLRRLGYDARLHLSPVDRFFYGVFEPRVHKNVAANGWIADYPGASMYFRRLLSCSAWAKQYCNRSLDRLAGAALAAQDDDPGAADRRWRQVYATVESDAVAIPLVHGRQSMLVSRRVGNYQSSAFLGPLFSQMWVR